MLLSQSDKFNLKWREESNKERNIHVAEGIVPILNLQVLENKKSRRESQQCTMQLTHTHTGTCAPQAKEAKLEKKVNFVFVLREEQECYQYRVAITPFS